MSARPSFHPVSRISVLLRRLCLGIVLASMAACSSKESESVAEAAPVDPRYASADALTAHVDDLMRQMNDGQISHARTFLSLVYAETPLQERFNRIASNADPLIALLDSAISRFPDVREAFMSGFEESVEDEFGGVVIYTPARIKSRDDRRAVIHWPESDDPDSELHLVEFDGRWWISGYTFEYDPIVHDALSGPDADEIERFTSSLAREARTLNDQLNSGTIASSEQFGLAIMGSLMRISAEYPEAQELFERLQEADGGRGFRPW